MFNNELKGIRILIAMNHFQVREGARDVAKRAGADLVVTVNKGDEAVEAIKENAFNFFLMEDDLEHHGGVEICQFLRRRDGPSAAAPFVLAMSDPAAALVRQALNSGVNTVAKLPLNPDTFVKLVVGLTNNPGDYVVTKSYRGPCRRRGRASFDGGERRQQSKGVIAAEKLKTILSRINEE